MSSSSAPPEASGAARIAADDLATYFLRIALLALAYYSMGRLGLLMAVPPGYATIIWPPSGIALAALLVYGRRLWPGIFLGSLIVNLDVSGALTALSTQKIAIAMGIASGSTLQTLLAHALVRKVLGNPIALRGWKDVLMLLMLAGPVGCLVAPSIGVATMYSFGVLSDTAWAANWLTWWKGDTFGVLVFMPLALIAPAGAAHVRWREHRFGALPAGGILALLIPLGLTFYAWKAIVHFGYEKNAAQFAVLAVQGEEALLRRMESYRDALLGGAGFFQGSQYVSRSEWHHFVDAMDIGKSYPGMRGIGWVAALEPEELGSYAARMRAEGLPDFEVHPRGAAADNFIITYLEPQEQNAAALGFNIASERKRHAAASLARDTGEATLTQRVHLVQDQSRSAGFLLLLPVYDKGRALTTVAQRRAALRGWIFTPLNGATLLAGVTKGLGHPLALTVYDGVEAPERLIYSNKSGGERTASMFSERRTLRVGQQHWMLLWESTSAFEAHASSHEPMLVLVGGLLLTGLFAGFLMVITRRAQTVQELVQQRTRQLELSEEALRSSEETFRSAMEHASIGMALVDPTGRFLRVNQALCDLLGYASSELTSNDFQSITHPDDLNADVAYVNEALSGARKSYQMEKRYFHKDGHAIWALLNVSLLRKSDGTPRYFVAQIQDITQRRQMDRMKSEFISTVSHELRTPLTSIRGSLGLIASGALGQLPRKIESMIGIAHTNSERLVRIVNDILDIERIESGRLDLSMRRVPMASFLRQALEENDAYGARFNVRFVLRSVPDDVEVMADHGRLMQVMANLMSNAAKFSSQGEQVIVRAARSATHVRIEVEDHGTGIPEEFRSRIFEKFAQADSSSSRRFEGTGLGLSITRQLVEAMGGTIGFTTEIGIGTTFHFELPCVLAGAPNGTLADAAVIRRKRSDLPESGTTTT